MNQEKTDAQTFIERQRFEIYEENAKMREALEKIEQGLFCRTPKCRCGALPEDMARRALEGKE